MKILTGLLLFAGFFLSSVAQTEKKITILHTNDLNSRLTGYTPESAYTPLTVKC